MEVNNQVIDLKQRQKEIKKLENKIEKCKKYGEQLEIMLDDLILELEKHEEELEELKKQYYYDYFAKERKLYTKLSNIPSICNLNIKTNEIHPLAKYSKFHLEELGEILVDYAKNKYNCETKSKIEIVETEKLQECTPNMGRYYRCKKPHLFVVKASQSVTDISFGYDKNIIADIPFTNVGSSTVKNAIKCQDNSFENKFLYYDYYNQLIANYPGNFFDSLYWFDKEYDSEFEKLIYNLAYYQKQINETQLPEGELLKAYKKIYKR